MTSTTNPSPHRRGRREVGALQDLIHDRRIRGFVFQGLVLIALGAVVYLIASNTAENLATRGIASGFGFLSRTAGFDVAMSVIPFEPTMSYGRVLLVGAINTLVVSALGIVASTILGIVLGVLRLSRNWLVARLVGAYIEITRNVPLLLLILFWYSFALALPRVRESLTIAGVVINNRGIYLPRLIFEPGAGFILWALMIALAIAAGVSMWARGRLANTGKPFPALIVSLFLIVALPAIAAVVMDIPWTWEMPVLKGFNYQGGIRIIAAFFALWFALTTYTAAFIAEIVRSGIEAVPRGQREAAEALGLREGIILRLVILPQALRVIIPPLTSQQLNLLKNSSLAVAIGYPDIVQVFAGTTLNQTGQAVEVIVITMAFYLIISLLISLFMNLYNRSIALKER